MELDYDFIYNAVFTIVYQRRRIDRAFSMIFHQHHSTEILYVTNGILKVDHLDVQNSITQTFLLTANQFTIFLPPVKHRISAITDAVNYMDIEFTMSDSKTKLPDFLKNLRPLPPLTTLLKRYSNGEYVLNFHDTNNLSDTLNSFINFMHDNTNKNSAMFCLKYKVFLENILIKVLENTELTQSKLGNMNINIVISYIANNFNKKITAAELAGLVNLSPSYFSAFFHKCIGKSVKEYIDDMRLSIAQQYIKKTNMELATIAKVCGFGSYRNLYNLFTSKYKFPPNQYRRQPENEVYIIDFNPW